MRNPEAKKAYDHAYYRRPDVMARDRERQRGRADYKRRLCWLKRYGITLEDFNRMFEQQHGRCGMCGKHQSELYHTLAVDHSHETGKVRGLLCTACNVRLGTLEDKAFQMVAEAYLADTLK